MMDGIRSYFLAVVAACMLAVLACALLKNSRLQRITRFIAGILILLTVATPLLRIDLSSLADQIASFGDHAGFDSRQVSKDYQAMLRTLVKENTEGYIEKKTEALGGTIRAEVTLGGGEYPQPVHVVLTGSMLPDAAKELETYIRDSLGIPPEEQEWKLYG